MKPQFLLPLLTYPDATSELLIANAVALARHRPASLTVCPVHVAIPAISNALSSIIIDPAKMARDAEALSRKRGAELVQKAAHEAEIASVELVAREIKVGQPFMGDATARAARSYDLVLLETGLNDQGFIEAVLFGAGRPLFLYPPSPFGGRIDHVAIAWDGSRSAARAAADAKPFLEQASKVSLISVVDEKPVDQESIGHAADNLARSGLNVETHRIQSRGEPIGQVLQSKASEAGADLLVMGGFGHSRLREFVLGGATQAILADITMPVLMSH